MVDVNWHKFLDSGDVKAFSAFYKAHVNGLYAYGASLSFSREICKDAIQDVFYKLFVDKDKLKMIGNIKAYLFKAYKNQLIDLFNNSEKTEDIASFPELPFSVEVDTADIIVDAEETENLRRKVETLLNALTPRQREAIYLRYMQQMDYDEISSVLKISSESVRKLVHRSILKLRKSSLSHADMWALLILLAGEMFGLP